MTFSSAALAVLVLATVAPTELEAAVEGELVRRVQPSQTDWRADRRLNFRMFRQELLDSALSLEVVANLLHVEAIATLVLERLSEQADRVWDQGDQATDQLSEVNAVELRALEARIDALTAKSNALEEQIEATTKELLGACPNLKALNEDLLRLATGCMLTLGDILELGQVGAKLAREELAAVAEARGRLAATRETLGALALARATSIRPLVGSGPESPGERQ